MYKYCDIFSCQSRGTIKISIDDYENDETINLEVTAKELLVLKDVIDCICNSDKYPITSIYMCHDDNEVFEDESGKQEKN